jgi:hypothetical protein
MVGRGWWRCFRMAQVQPQAASVHCGKAWALSGDRYVWMGVLFQVIRESWSARVEVSSLSRQGVPVSGYEAWTRQGTGVENALTFFRGLL